jgi:hypothetical protein
MLAPLLLDKYLMKFCIMESAAANSPTEQFGTTSPQLYFYDLPWYY